MDFKSFKAPFIKNEFIKAKAEALRKKYWNDDVPVDIEKIIEFKIGIKIIPKPELEKLCNIDAFISSDWDAIYVDNDCYSDERYYNRLRFSLAHEIGHFVLHKEIYENFKINGIEEYYDFLRDIQGNEYGFIEMQAQNFAGYLLIPVGRLINEKNKILSQYKNLPKVDSTSLNSFLATPISKIFGVSPQAAETALNYESSRK